MKAPSFAQIREGFLAFLDNSKKKLTGTTNSPGKSQGGPDDDRNSITTPPLKDPDSTASFVMNLYEEWAADRAKYEQTWYTNLAYYVGQQWAEWNRAARAMVEPRAPSWRVRYTQNRILPQTAIRRGKINRGQFPGKAIPLQRTETAFSDARVMEKVLRALHDPLSMTEVYSDTIDWALIMGTGIVKVGWDPLMGPEVPTPDGRSLRLGEVAVDAIGPPDIFVPPDLKNFNRPFRIIHAGVFDIEVLRAWYPDTARGLIPDSEGDRYMVGNLMQQAATLVTSMTAGGRMAASRGGSKCYVLELWEDPEVLHPDDAEEFPNGRVTVVAQQRGIVLSQHENPYRQPIVTGSRLPFAMMRDDKVPDRFWGMSRIEQLTPIQKNYNKGRSQMIEARDLTCKPKLLREQNDGIVKVTNEPGEQLKRRPGAAKPEYLEQPQLSSYMVTDLLEDKFAFQEISQQSEATRGQNPGANTPGIAIDMLQQADNTPLGPFATEVSGCISKVQTMQVQRVHQFYGEERTLTYVGEDNEEDVFTFSADKHPTPLRVKVAPEAVFPATPASKQMKTEKALELGVLDPIRDRVTALRMMELDDTDVIFENADLHRQRANRENRKMSEGIPQKAEAWHNHEIDIYQHDRLRNSAEWERLPPEIQMLISAHVEEHLALLAGAMQALGAVEGPGPGADQGPPGGDPGAPPGPMDPAGVPPPGGP